MTTISSSVQDAKETLTDLVNQVVQNGERVTLTRRGKAVAAIVSIEDLKNLLELQNRDDLRDAVESLDEARKDGTLTMQALLDEIGTAS